MATDSDSDSNSGGFKLYHYSPSLAAAVMFALFFAAVSIRHLQLLIKARTWAFIPFLVGCMFETIGYAARAYSSNQTPDWKLMPYIIQNILILLGPTLFAASIYMVLGRLIRVLDAQDYSLIRVQRLTKLFLLGDVLSIFGQGGGGGLLASSHSKSTQDLGNNIILLGLGIQVVFFSGFMMVTAIFHIRIIRHPTIKSQATPNPWRRFLWVLYFSSMLIMVRSAFRMVEYAQGNNGSLLKKEVYSYILDALLMLLAAAIFTVYHPSEVLRDHKTLGRGAGFNANVDNFPMGAQSNYRRMT
ncbi:RTA1 like protein-domain-containing protein [Thelonectria olida]|uniref:RTA1 like protein-domain-containing protein n=1 Tax=Thelonectria olida TaxID=1576542 RepID=A0A9P8VRR3_9HYPO|nr:RTA1 like protein-domain-containing protein [Thelonectria olida]